LVDTASLTVPGRVEFVRPATAFLVQAARAMHVSAAAEPVFEVAVSEAITNAVKHGSASTPSCITCQVELSETTLTLRIIDAGHGFVMRNPGMPEVSRERIDAVPASGYGLPIIHTVFPVVRVGSVEGRFCLELSMPLETVKS
jgi:anti-sigma regulatory factor (Ser/Thr protein kinase)